ncbi:MAG TPA: UDP-N-acetylglucosamine 1-carboxyvinyltransferase, partial [Phycisphaerales bacterium]|nr:UDP-N-acetylglucosamine 1-carboxyvinyltransferase [Phycisphaerales bacterium]
PVDQHIKGLQAMGATIEVEHGYMVASLPAGRTRLKGARIATDMVTVTGTENFLMAATLAEGETVLENAAQEPEIPDLAEMLIRMGAKIEGHGTRKIRIQGVERLRGCTHPVVADRIEAGTYVMAAAVTNGDVVLENCPVDALTSTFDRLKEIGVEMELPPDDCKRPNRLRETIRVASARRLDPVEVVTQPHPGFPTDLQAQIMALLSLADGNSIITERIYPQRFLHVAELTRMGAQLIRQGSTVVATGVRELVGAPVMASDLRASASLVIAALAARGRTTIHRVYHLDRGYHRMEDVLRRLGARIERVDDKHLPTVGSD